MNRKKVAILTTLPIVVLAVGATIMWRTRDRTDDRHMQDTAGSQTVISNRIGLVVERDRTLTQKPVSEENEKKGQLWGFSQPADSQQEFLIDANYEQGPPLKKLTGYTKQSLRDSVMGNIGLQLPKQYPEYREITQRNLTVNGVDANETIFEYNASGHKVKQRLLLLFKNSDTAVYIRGQAKVDAYEEINRRYFDPLFSSAKFK